MLQKTGRTAGRESVWRSSYSVFYVSSCRCFNEPECHDECGLVDTQECTIIHRQECKPVAKEFCSIVDEPVCSTVYEKKCSTVSERQCSTGRTTTI